MLLKMSFIVIGLFNAFYFALYGYVCEKWLFELKWVCIVYCEV